MDMRSLVIVLTLVMISAAAMGATMHGYVLKSTPSDQKWVAGASIRCSNQYGDFQATSGSDGYYAIQGMRPGRYTCSASADGYYSAIREVLIECPCENDTCNCNSCNPCDTNYKRVDFFLSPAPGKATIHGHVFKNGAPAQAEVSCDGHSAMSDESGYYEMELDPGTYYCSADGMNGKSIVISGGENRVVNFFISAPSTTTIAPSESILYGHVYANGQPVVADISCGGFYTKSSQTGYYSIVLPSGMHECTASYGNHEKQFSIYVSGQTHYDIHISYAVIEKHKLYGHVYGNGLLDNVQVSCNGNIAYTSNGYYEMYLDEGNYECTFSHVGYFAKSVHVVLNADERLDVRLDAVERRFRLYGVANPTLTISCSGPEYHRALASGSYSIEMKEGSYECTASSPGYESYSFPVVLTSDRRVDISLRRKCSYGFEVSGGGEKSGYRATFMLNVFDHSSCRSEYEVSFSSDCDHVSLSPERFSGSSSVYITAQSSKSCEITVHVKSVESGEEKSVKFRLDVDMKPPSISASSSCNPPGIHVEAYDESGVSEIMIKRSSSVIKDCHAPECDASVEYGKATYTVIAVDSHGNRAWKYITMNCCRNGVLEGVVRCGSRAAHAIVKCDGRAVETDSHGSFSMELPEGDYACTFLADGCTKKTMWLGIHGRKHIYVYLQPESRPCSGCESWNATSWNVIARSVESGAEIEEKARPIQDWWYYARAVLWWIALILAIALLIFIILVIVSSS